MDTRRSYEYAKPTTLVLIISDALGSLHPTTSPLSMTFLDAQEIVADAYNALTENVGTEDTNDMLLSAGIGPAELDAVWHS